MQLRRSRPIWPVLIVASIATIAVGLGTPTQVNAQAVPTPTGLGVSTTTVLGLESPPAATGSPSYLIKTEDGPITTEGGEPNSHAWLILTGLVIAVVGAAWLVPRKLKNAILKKPAGK